MSSDAPLLSYRDALVYPSDLALLDSPSAWLNDRCINFQMTRLQHRLTAGNDGARGRRSGGRQPDGAEGDGGGCVQPDDLFLDPSVVSFLVHQLPEDDEDFAEEASNVIASWKLPRQSNSCPSDGEHQRKRIFVPISDQFGADRSAFVRPGGGMHWSLLLWEIGAFYGDDASDSLGIRFHHFDSSRGCNASAATAVASKLLKVMRAAIPTKEGTIDAVGVIECRSPQQRNSYDCGVFTLGFAEALSSSGGFGIPKERRESLLAKYFEGNGGHDEFALRLREQIGNDIRNLPAGRININCN